MGFKQYLDEYSEKYLQRETTWDQIRNMAQKEGEDEKEYFQFVANKDGINYKKGRVLSDQYQNPEQLKRVLNVGLPYSPIPEQQESIDVPPEDLILYVTKIVTTTYPREDVTDKFK